MNIVGRDAGTAAALRDHPELRQALLDGATDTESVAPAMTPWPDRPNHRFITVDGTVAAYSVLSLDGGTLLVDFVGPAADYYPLIGRTAPEPEPAATPVPAWRRAVARIEPTHWLLLLATVAAWRVAVFWSGDSLYSVGFIVAPWAYWYVLKQPHAGRASAANRGLAFAITLATVFAGWQLRSVPLALWGVVFALLVHALEHGVQQRVTVPLVLLAITVPPPGFDDFLLAGQQAVARGSAAWLAASGLAITRDSFLITTANHRYSVEPLCTGLTGVLASILLVGMTSVHVKVPPKRAWAALGIAVVATLLLNIERIVLLVAVTERYGPGLIEGAFHEAVGLALSLTAFAVALPMLLSRKPLWPIWPPRSDRPKAKE